MMKRVMWINVNTPRYKEVDDVVAMQHIYDFHAAVAHQARADEGHGEGQRGM